MQGFFLGRWGFIHARWPDESFLAKKMRHKGASNACITFFFYISQIAFRFGKLCKSPDPVCLA
jgi:hypothetical protein